MNQDKLYKILENHKLWLNTNGEDGARADLRYADLRNADLRYANLRYANLRNANLCNADLCNADLRNVDLCNVDLRNVDLSNADLCNADLDYSVFPLWCGGLDVHIDDKQATQLLYHLIRNVQHSKNTSKSLKKICRIKSLVKQANKFHRVNECGEIKGDVKDDE